MIDPMLTLIFLKKKFQCSGEIATTIKATICDTIPALE